MPFSATHAGNAQVHDPTAVWSREDLRGCRNWPKKRRHFVGASPVGVQALLLLLASWRDIDGVDACHALICIVMPCAGRPAAVERGLRVPGLAVHGEQICLCYPESTTQHEPRLCDGGGFNAETIVEAE